MRNRIILFINGFLVWMLLCWPPDIQNIVVGIFVSALVVFLTSSLFKSRSYHPVGITRYLWFGYYIPVFLWECLKANIDVARRVINPRLPIKPGIVKIKTSLRSDTALTFLANSITLTPGTLCVDIEPNEGVLYIHWIDVRTDNVEKATEIIASKFERILKKIFE